MKLKRSDLDWAADNGLLNPEQVEPLWKGLENRASDVELSFANLAYYLGAFLVIGAMGWFMTEAWLTWGAAALIITSGGYATVFVLAGRTLWFDRQIRVAGGLLFVVAVSMTPIFVYGIENAFGFWPSTPSSPSEVFFPLHANRIAMELATIAAGLIALRWIRFPFLIAPVAVAVFALAQDIAPLVLGYDTWAWDEMRWVSMGFGLLMILLALRVDGRHEEDWARWGYIFGAVTFWFGLTLSNTDSEILKLIYLSINVGLLLFAVLIRRPVFVLFGSVGIFIYLLDISRRLFEGSLLFPIALVAIGVMIILGGVRYQTNREVIEARMRAVIPEALRSLLPPER